MGIDNSKSNLGTFCYAIHMSRSALFVVKYIFPLRSEADAPFKYVVCKWLVFIIACSASVLSPCDQPFLVEPNKARGWCIPALAWPPLFVVNPEIQRIFGSMHPENIGFFRNAAWSDRDIAKP